MSQHTESSNELNPAKLGFIAIYNPTLGSTDSSLENQTVYYYSSTVSELNRSRRGSKNHPQDSDTLRQQKDEQSRQIGLAQGMVEFAKNFSGGKCVDTIDTEKSRIVLHELEPDWWILVSINLTILPRASNSEQQRPVEYSARDVKPAKLILVDLQRAHSIFLMHHAPSINYLYTSTKRSDFLSIFSRYWNLFIMRWNVLMHGNPTNNLYRGIKVAGCGELGMGVGEENRGSGEREVLEGFAHRVEGIVDVIVSRFGDNKEQGSHLKVTPAEGTPDQSWIGLGNEPDAEDGAIFLGSGALSRNSLRDLTNWVEDIFRWGAYTYGVIDDPKASRRSKRSRKEFTLATQQIPSKNTEHDRESIEVKLNPVDDKRTPQITSHFSVQKYPKALDPKKYRKGHSPSNLISKAQPSLENTSNQGSQIFDYLKLGYGSHWTLSGTWLFNEAEKKYSNDTIPDNLRESSIYSSQKAENPVLDQASVCGGRFLIGLIDDNELFLNNRSDLGTANPSNKHDFKAYKPRITLRTVTLGFACKNDDLTGEKEQEPLVPLGHPRDSSGKYSEFQDTSKLGSFQVVVYTAQPLIFVFILRTDTDGLESPNLYHSLHHQLQPILKPLWISTKYRAIKPELQGIDLSEAPIYDLIWDPENLILNSSIPNIPELSEYPLPGSVDLPWSAAEARNTHMQIVKTIIACEDDSSELERICKTSRGWWIVWARLSKLVSESSRKIPSKNSIGLKLPTELKEGVDDTLAEVIDLHKPNSPILYTNSELSQSSLDSTHQNSSLFTRKEIILLRRACDLITTKPVSIFSNTSLALGTEKDWDCEPSNLAQGIGFDTQQYIERLMNIITEM